MLLKVLTCLLTYNFDICERILILFWQKCTVCNYCAVLCATTVHSAMHTYMNKPNSSLDWVLSHWARFTVLRFIFEYVCICVSLHIACFSVVTW